MIDNINEYIPKLERAIMEYMSMPASERSSSAIVSMIGCWDALDSVKKKMDCKWTLTPDDAVAWTRGMQNADGTTGGHWTVDQTSGVASSIGVDFTHITPVCFNAAMNMMYSDYSSVASYFGVSTPEFYAEMAKAFLFDKDGPGPLEKMGAYYHCIAKKAY